MNITKFFTTQSEIYAYVYDANIVAECHDDVFQMFIQIIFGSNAEIIVKINKFVQLLTIF